MVSPSRFCCGAETLTNFLGLLVIGTLGSLTVPLLVRKVKSGVSDAIISTGELTKLSACSLAGASLSYDETNSLGALTNPGRLRSSAYMRDKASAKTFVSPGMYFTTKSNSDNASSHRACRGDKCFCVRKCCSDRWSVSTINLQPNNIGLNLLSDSTIANNSCS